MTSRRLEYFVLDRPEIHPGCSVRCYSAVWRLKVEIYWIIRRFFGMWVFALDTQDRCNHRAALFHLWCGAPRRRARASRRSLRRRSRCLRNLHLHVHRRARFRPSPRRRALTHPSDRQRHAVQRVPPAFVQRLMQLSYVGTMYLMLMNASSPPYISMSCSVSRMSSPTHVFFRCP